MIPGGSRNIVGSQQSAVRPDEEGQTNAEKKMFEFAPWQ